MYILYIYIIMSSVEPGTTASSQLLEYSRALRQALHSLAERILLPGALELWPHLQPGRSSNLTIRLEYLISIYIKQYIILNITIVINIYL